MKKQINKFFSDFGIPEYYQFYRETVKYDKFLSKYSENKELIADKVKFNEIITDFFKLISEKILKGEIIDFPSNLGNLGIKKKKMNFGGLLKYNKLQVDWKTYKATGKITYFTNDHTDGHYAKWIWNKSKCRIPTKTYYKFIPSRTNKRAIAKVFKQGGDFTEAINKKYIPLDNVNT